MPCAPCATPATPPAGPLGLGRGPPRAPSPPRYALHAGPARPALTYRFIALLLLPLTEPDRDRPPSARKRNNIALNLNLVCPLRAAPRSPFSPFPLSTRALITTRPAPPPETPLQSPFQLLPPLRRRPAKENHPHRPLPSSLPQLRAGSELALEGVDLLYPPVVAHFGAGSPPRPAVG